MLQGWVILLSGALYLSVLFGIAYYGDQRAAQGRSLIANPYVYALSLAVYATSWTFYGSVGRATVSGLGFLPIYLGPTLMAALWWLVVRKMIRISKTHRLTSIADFVASRYGKSQLLGGLVTLIAVFGIVPYIALQLKAVSNSYTLLQHYPEIVMPAKAGLAPFLSDSAFYTALLMAAFTIAFGTRHLDASERHEGMVAAIAFESLVKLLAFVAVGVFVTWFMYGGLGDVFARAAEHPGLRRLLSGESLDGKYGSWAWLTLLSMFAILFLPRQYQVAVVENVDEGHLRKAVWLFPLYLLAMNLFVLPIAIGGVLHFPGGGVDADSYVLTLPMAQQQEALALLVFIGGLSAATGMIIVETIALSTMVCNDLIMPVLLRWRRLGLAERSDLTGLLLGIRRGAIVVIVLLGYLYFHFAGEAYALVSIGLISFAAVAQFAPAILGGLFWKGGTRAGALAGLSAGFAVWLYTLVLPSFAKSGWLPADFLHAGPWGLELLRPQQLFGLGGLDEITHAMIWSMLFNAGLYLAFSLRGHASPAEHSQAALFVDVFKEGGGERVLWRGTASVPDLRALLERFLGGARAAQLLTDYARARGLASVEQLRPDADLVRHAEKLLAGVIGAASARILVASVAKEETLGMEEVMGMLDEASQIIAYSHRLEQKSRELEAATAELRAANAQLQELDRMKDDFVSTVSHELRTPLTSIRAFSEILRDNPGLDTEQRARMLAIIVQESERLTRLINQVLDLARLESGRADWRVAAVDVAEVSAAAVEASSQLFNERGVSLERHLPDEPLLVLADRDRLIQVIINLLSNAAKFSPQGNGRVVLRAVLVAGRVRVEISDNGPGIEAADQAVIFDKFHQAGDTLTAKPQGTGLGLHISQQIIGYFGGRIRVRSAPGQGSTFSFELPAEAAGREEGA